MSSKLEQAITERLAKLDVDYQRQRRALLTVLEMETIPNITTRNEIEEGSPRTKGQMAWVKAAIETLVASGKTEFTKDDVGDKLREIQPTVGQNVFVNMATFLWRLHKDGLIKIQEKGQGHRQSVYMVAQKEKEPPTGTTP